MEETSLEDFLEGDGKSADADGSTAEAVDEGAADRPDETLDDVEPPTVTAAWSPDGSRCAACGERLGWGWGSETGLVCRDCKEW